MNKRGVTKEGFVKKRLDELISEVQANLSDGYGFNVAQNPQSFLNVLTLNFCDRLAQLWEVAEQVYFSRSPSSAEGVALDDVAQYGGITREQDRRTIYTIVCAGKDGTKIGKDSRIASNTTPQLYFTAIQDYVISREAFTTASVKVVSVVPDARYSVKINGNEHVVTSGSNPSAKSILEQLKNAITESNFSVTIEDEMLLISCNDERKTNLLILSENLTTDTVSSLFLFQSEDYGKIVLPPKSITEIVTTVVGFKACYNLSSPSYGRLRETDIEFRQSYLHKIASRSSMMLETIVAAILENVENVQSASAYQNDTNIDCLDYAEECIEAIRRMVNEGAVTSSEVSEAIQKYDSEKALLVTDLPAHTIEVVVDGGDEGAIAEQIMKTKAAGIGTFGSISVDVPDLFGNPVSIRFNRPETIYVWLKVVVYKNPSQAMPVNAEEIIKASIVSSASEIKAGDDILTQDFVSNIRENCYGISYIDITAYQTKDENDTPADGDYNLRSVYPTQRQKAVISEGRIEVVFNAT